jgi:hypothetical protein
VIWLTWRRYRVLVAVVVVLLVALGLWMGELAHAFDQARNSAPCRYRGGFNVPFCSGPRGFISLPAQASIVDLILLALPCALGAAFGAPLVASELEHHTNRLMWTQGISRVRWFLSKWAGLAVIVVALVALLTLETQWWTSHVFEVSSLNVSPGNFGRLSPDFFPISGVAAVAYTLFALSLGTAAGALLRRTPLAIAATVVVYAVVALVMVVSIRPNLAPQTFVVSGYQGDGRVGHIGPESWYLGNVYVYAPGSPEVRTASVSAGAVSNACESEQSYFGCLAAHHVQFGGSYLLASEYWEMQWKESAILFGLSVVLLGGSVLAVRAWRA